MFGLAKVEGKGSAKWRRIILMTKSETHDSYLLYDSFDTQCVSNCNKLEESFGFLHELCLLEF